MKVLVINGSPKGRNSNTMRLTNAFLEGMALHRTFETVVLPVYNLDIKPCRGCFGCWHTTPGCCCIKDDMAQVLDRILESDMIIWSFPLYYFSLPSQLKALMDRQLPLSLPHMDRRPDGNPDSGSHPSRYDMSQKQYAVISTCGFYTAQGNYDAVNIQFDRCFGSKNYAAVYCGQGELFRLSGLPQSITSGSGTPDISEIRQRTSRYLGYVKTAGAEFADGGITGRTKELLSSLILPREVFEQGVNSI